MAKPAILMILYTDENCYSKVNYNYEGASISRKTTVVEEISDLAILKGIVCKLTTIIMTRIVTRRHRRLIELAKDLEEFSVCSGWTTTMEAESKKLMPPHWTVKYSKVNMK